MSKLLITAIDNGNEAEALRLIDLMGPEEFNEDYSKFDWQQIPLHHAAYKGLEKVVDKIIFIKPGLIKCVDKYDQTILHCVASNGSEAMIYKLLSIEPKLAEFTEIHGRTPLHLAANYGKDETVQRLLLIKSELAYVIDIRGQTPLHYAAQNGHKSIVDKILSINPDLAKVVDQEGKTALHLAAKNGRKAVVNKLLSINPDLAKVVDQEGKTALYYAAENGNEIVGGCFPPEMIHLALRIKDKQNDDPYIRSYLNKSIKYFANLIEKYPDSVDNYYKLGNILFGLGKKAEGLKAYERVLELDSTNYAERIISNLASIIDANNQYILNPVALSSYDNIIQIALAKIPSKILNAADRNNKTILYRIAEAGKDKAVELLLSKIESQTIIQTIIKAAKERQKKIIGILDKVSAEILSMTDEMNKTALYRATHYENAELVQLLIKKMNLQTIVITDGKGKTALDLSAEMAKNIPNKTDVDKEKEPNYQDSNSNKENTKLELDNEKLQKIVISKAKEISYSNDKVDKLLDVLKGTDVVKAVINLEQGELPADKVEKLLKPALEDGKTVVAALHLHGASWASLVIKKQEDDNLQVLYNDPRGLPFGQEKNAKALIYSIRDLEDKASVIDLRQKQQITDSDSAPFVVDNLTTLAKTDTNGLKKPALQKLLAKQDQVNTIKQNHLITQDTSPWYSDDKLSKLLHIKLDAEKQVNIAPVTVFEHKDLLIENVSVAAKEVIDNSKIAVMPIHIHDNHWTALVIKKQADGSLQILYNDPKGNSLMSEKNSGALLKAISKLNAEFTLVDIRLKQQDNDDDCGLYTIENLVKLAITDTSNMHKNQLQQLLGLDNNNNDSLIIRTLHSTELEKAGIPVLPPRYSNDNELAKKMSDFDIDFGINNSQSFESDFTPPTPPSNDHDMEVSGMTGNNNLY